MTNYNISYIIATKNRLPFLKITLGRLLKEVLPGEEIVVVDSDSTDGTKEYLQLLFDQGKIHQFISESDKNQAHGWNKALLMTNGTIIKKIIDDDVFCYSSIRKCTNYMLQNPAIDVMLSNDLNSNLDDSKTIIQSSRLAQFEKWNSGELPSFTFGDVHMLIRKSALAYIGLYNTSFTMMDWEYSLRISYLKANISYYTGYNALTVAHPQTITSLKDTDKITKQGKRGEVFYEYAGDYTEISLWSKIKIFIGSQLSSLKPNTTEKSEVTVEDVVSIYDHYYKHINQLNDSLQATFKQKNNPN